MNFKKKKKNFRSTVENMVPDCVFFQKRAHASEWRKVLCRTETVDSFVIKHMSACIQTHIPCLHQAVIVSMSRWGDPVHKDGALGPQHIARSGNKAPLSHVVL